MIKLPPNKHVNLIIVLCLAAVVFTAGCSGPRARWGFTPLEKYGDPNRLGTHSYHFSGSEGYGVLYTLRGGSIDPDHVRGIADLTRWTYIRAKATIEKGNKSFAVGPAFEMTKNKVEIEYPDNWDNLTPAEKEHIAREAALIIAPVVSYNCSIWHEMLTWKGTHFALIEPEHNSAFSWDDLYSNLIGAELAIQAIKDGNIKVADYNRAMTRLIDEELQRLQVVSRTQAIEIIESVRGTWHNGIFELMKRNMDIGYDDGVITPSLVPGYTDEESISRTIPTLGGLDELGITVKYTISSIYFENMELKKIAGSKGPVEPIKHYPKIMENIEAEAIDKYGYMIR
ncbi:MAG: DUF4056 domain-containing protein [Planctomycetota bacterium]|jgi:hypothetical protein